MQTWARYELKNDKWLNYELSLSSNIPFHDITNVTDEVKFIRDWRQQFNIFISTEYSGSLKEYNTMFDTNSLP